VYSDDVNDEKKRERGEREREGGENTIFLLKTIFSFTFHISFMHIYIYIHIDICI